MPEFQAILFDFDGVLVDSEPVHLRLLAGGAGSVGRERSRGRSTRNTAWGGG